MSDRVKKLEIRRNQIVNNEEFENFTSLIDDVRYMFQPDNQRLRQQVAKGTKLNRRRVSDVGISMLSDYASGIQSEMTTSGEEWFEYFDKEGKDEDIELVDGLSQITNDRMNASNFHTEFHRDLKGGACDGTACMYVERLHSKLNYIHVPFGHFWFVQDFSGRPDTVWVEKKTTAGALVGKFGEEGVSDKCKKDNDHNPDKEVSVIYYCTKRTKRDATKKDQLNKPYEFLIYEKDNNYILEEGGVDMQKFIVYRVKRVADETLGRGPAIDTACTMYAVERCSKDMQRGLRLSVVPVYGVAASMGQNGFRMIHQEDASVMVYDDTGMANPPQTMNPPVNVEFGQAYLEWQIGQMRQLFFLDYFNPLDNRRNMTLGEAKERVSKAQQMVDQIVGPLKEERLDPLLKWTMILLGEAGEFNEYGSWEEIQERMGGRIGIRYKSRLANMQKKIRLMSIAEYTEMTMFIGQGIPDPTMQFEFMVQTDFSKLPKEIREGTNAPDIIKRADKEVKQLTKGFQDAMAAQAETDNAVKMADAASKGGTAPEAGSLTGMVLGTPQQQ